MANDNGKARLGGGPPLPPLAASKPRALWKKSVETLKTQPTVISPGPGPSPTSASGPGPPQMKSQRYLPEEPPLPHSDISECSSRPPSHKDSDSMGPRAGFKAVNQLRKRGGGGGSGSKIYSIDSDQASLQSAPPYQRDSQGGADELGYPPDLFPPEGTYSHSHPSDAPILQLSATLLHHSHSAEADLHSMKDKKYSTYTHSRYVSPKVHGASSERVTVTLFRVVHKSPQTTSCAEQKASPRPCWGCLTHPHLFFPVVQECLHTCGFVKSL